MSRADKEKFPVYEAPTRADFQAKVSSIIHETRRKLDAENGRLIVATAARGLSQNGGLISDVVSCADRLHADAIDKLTRLAAEFVGRSKLTPTDLGNAARPLLANLTIQLLARLQTQRYLQPQGQRALAQYTQVFEQRLERALRDIQIGFVGGQSVISREPLILHNIKVENSVVGSINTGNVQAIDVSLTNLRNTGNDKAGDALEALIEAILGDKSIGETQKNELVEQLAFLSEQTTVATKDRKPGVIKATLGALSQAAGTVSAVSGAWQAAEPILKNLFGL
jgi:hypothetical protein